MASIENIFWGIHTFKLSWKTNAKTIVVRTILALLSYLIPKKIITVSAKSMGYHTRIGYCADKFVVIANGFDFRSIKQEDMPKFKLRKRYNLPRDARLIGTVGRFHHDKNYDMLIDVARIAVEEVPSLFFVLIGQGLDYSNKHLLEKIKRYKMANNFLLLGARDDAIECMSQFDVFCLTSRTEAFPLVVGEAMSLGIPVVSTNVGDIPMILGDTGYIHDICDVKGFASTVIEIIKMSDLERRVIG